MTTFEVSKSTDMFERAKSVIPGGIYGHYGYSVRDTGPKFFSRADAAHFWDLDDNRYIDYMCAYGPMILGYGHKAVEEAANNTALAVMIARAATGRRKVIKVSDGYHGVAAWMLGNRPGTTKADTQDILEVPWNDTEELQRLIDEHPGDIAAFISSPYDHPVFRDNSLPAPGYWQKAEALCKKNGIVLIVDDVRAGFRINLAGSNVEYGFTPDLICFGKAIANGHPLAALVGTDALRKTAQEVYFTGTQFFNAAPMAAAKATLQELQKVDAANLMTKTGNKLNAGLVKVASNHGYKLIASGIPAMPFYRLDGVPFETHQAWIDECVRRGVYLLAYHNHFVSTAHTDTDIQQTFEIVDDAFTALGHASTRASLGANQ